MKRHQALQKFLVLAIISSAAVIINHKRFLHPAAVAQHLHKGALARTLLANNKHKPVYCYLARVLQWTYILDMYRSHH